MIDPSPRFMLAVDVGQSRDYTAVVILHSYRVREMVDDMMREERRHDLVHIERFRELSYPDQVRRIAERYRELQQVAQRDYRDATVRLVVDATGVGKPVLDLMRESGLKPRGVIITGGETSSSEGNIDRVPKRELVTTLQVALQAKRLVIAEELPLAGLLLKELSGFRVKINLAGHASFGNDVGSWREAAHDDLVLATALGVWTLEARKVGCVNYLRAASGLA
jgi:hypothetical protein